MIVTQRKRIVHDEVGNLCKIDILQSVRRKDAPGTLITDPEDKYMDAITYSAQRKSKAFIKYSCLLTIFLLLLAVYFCFSSKQQLKESSPIQRVEDLAVLSKKQFSLSELLALSHFEGKWNKQTQSRLLQSTICKSETKGSISCRFNFSSVINNDTLY